MKRKSDLAPYLFLLPVLIILLVFFGIPLLKSVQMAFSNYYLTKPNDVYFIGLENFKKLTADASLPMIIRNTIIYVVAAVGMQFLLGLGLASALRKPFKGRGIYQSIVFLPWAFSGFVIGLMFRWSFNGEYGIINHVLSLITNSDVRTGWIGTPGLSLLVVIIAMIWMGIPFFGIMLLAALQSIPSDIYESAALDGCGKISGFFYITLPYIKPTILMTLLLRTIWVFNSFELIMIITDGGPAGSSSTLASYMYNRAFSNYDFGQASAVGLLFIAGLIVFASLFMWITKYNKAGDF